ncbi:MAG: FUSC family protein [Gammaproteobacteria bacterium]|jgi:uncharacterized membrane protein YccC
MIQKIQLQDAFKLALSMMLFYWLTLYMDWDMPQYGALAIIVTSLSTSGASFNKGIMRVSGTGLGALAGFVLLFWFSQSPLGMLLGMTVYVIFIGYFIQTTRQADTWFNAGLLGVAVWSSSYMKVDTAFHFATTRFLETAAGVLLFTVVSALFWPRTSGASLRRQGQALWDGFQELFKQYRRQLSTGTVSAEVAELRTRLAGEYQQLLATLQAAYSDTPVVGAKKRSWEILRINLRTFGSEQELWRESINDCRELDLEKLLPGLGSAVDTLGQRLQRGHMLWEEQKSTTVEYTLDDTVLLKEILLQLDNEAGHKLTRIQQAALANFLTHLHSLDRSSRELLQTLRVLANLDPGSRSPGQTEMTDPFQPSAWNPERLLKALFPAICWIVGYAVWYYINPPGGPAIPMMCVVFGLMMVMSPANLFGLLIVLLLCMFVVVAPVYMLLMPTLDSGFGLLSLVFIYTFVFAYLGGRSPILKIGPLVMFVMLVNINNQQAYSFMALIVTAQMLLLGISIVVIVNRLLSPMHPEKIMLRSVQHFLAGSARIIDEYRICSPRQQLRGRQRRKRVFEAAILPLSIRLPNVVKNLDYPLFPDNTPEKVQHLVDSLLSVRLRLQSVEATYSVAESESPELLQALVLFNEKWRQHIRGLLDKWARLEQTDTPVNEWSTESTFSQELEQELEQKLGKLQQDNKPGDTDSQDLRNIYAIIGSTRSLLDAMKELGDSMKQINWHQWAVARF